MTANYQKRSLSATEHYIIKQIQTNADLIHSEELDSAKNREEKSARMFGTLAYNFCQQRSVVRTSKNYNILPDRLHRYLSLGFDESKECAFLGFNSDFKQFCDMQVLGLVGAIRNMENGICYLGLQMHKIYNGINYVGNHNFAVKVVHPDLIHFLQKANELVLLELDEGEVVNQGQPVPLVDLAKTKDQYYKQTQVRKNWQQNRRQSSNQPSFKAQAGYKKPNFGKKV